MKNLYLCLIGLMLVLTSYGQNSTTTLFAQCKFSINDVNQMKALEQSLRNNPHIKVARLDFNTQRAFVITKDLDQLNESDFISWFEIYSDSVRCIQIGTHGVDAVNPYPFIDCEND